MKSSIPTIDIQVILFCFITVLFFQCSVSNETSGNGLETPNAIHGVALVEGTSEPLVNAKIYLVSQNTLVLLKQTIVPQSSVVDSTFTDSSGWYLFEEPGYGQFSVYGISNDYYWATYDSVTLSETIVADTLYSYAVPSVALSGVIDVSDSMYTIELLNTPYVTHVTQDSVYQIKGIYPAEYTVEVLQEIDGLLQTVYSDSISLPMNTELDFPNTTQEVSQDENDTFVISSNLMVSSSAMSSALQTASFSSFSSSLQNSFSSSFSSSSQASFSSSVSLSSQVASSSSVSSSSQVSSSSSISSSSQVSSSSSISSSSQVSSSSSISSSSPVSSSSSVSSNTQVSSSSSVSSSTQVPSSSSVSSSAQVSSSSSVSSSAQVSSSSSVSSSSQITLTLIASQDATIRGPANQSTTGSKDNYSIGSMPRMAVGVWDEQSVDKALVQFDLPSGYTGADVDNALFRVSIYEWANHVATDDITIRIHRLLKSWKEGTSTADAIATAQTDGVTGAERFWGLQDGTEDWNLRGVGLDDVDAVSVAETELIVTSELAGFIEFDITQMVKYWLDNPSENYGFIMVNIFTMGNSQHKYPIFHTSEGVVTDAEKPLLVILIK